MWTFQQVLYTPLPHPKGMYALGGQDFSLTSHAQLPSTEHLLWVLVLSMTLSNSGLEYAFNEKSSQLFNLCYSGNSIKTVI